MAGINEDPDRQVVPLWRTFTTTARRGELGSVAAVNEARFSDDMVANLRREWEEHPILLVASDLVSVALTLGRFDVARQAAEDILSDSSASPSAKDIAELYLERGKRPTSKGQTASIVLVETSRSDINSSPLRQQLQMGISETKKKLIAYPRNPMLWGNLALRYTSLGLYEKAERAIRSALALAPDNRFVLRSASRFYLHAGERNRAHRLLADAAIVRADPWVLSAEIATAAAIGKTSRNIKIARKILERQRHPPFHLSELASAIGTLESQSGNMKTARPLVAYSLRDPAENSIAQAAWLHRNFGRIGIEQDSTPSSEANAWFAWRAARWESALVNAKRWLSEQPFSSRPAMLGSHIASVMVEDYAEAAALARQGLLSNPDDFALRNSLAFSLAQQDEVLEAAKAFKHVEEGRLTEQQRIVWMATRGLIAFRSGDLTAGRHLYREAFSLGARIHDVREIIARIYYAREELRVGAADAEHIRKGTLEAATSLTEPSYLVMVDRLKYYQPNRPTV